MSYFATTKDQIFVEKIAMETFRTCGLIPNRLDHNCRIDASISKEIVKLPLDVLARILLAHPEMPVSLGPDRHRFTRNWAQSIAIEIVTQEIRRIVGTSPRHATRPTGDNWIFLGGDRREPVNLARTLIKWVLPRPSSAYVDLWGNPQTSAVKVIQGTRHSDILEAKLGLHRFTTPGLVKEAFRRLHLVAPPKAS